MSLPTTTEFAEFLKGLCFSKPTGGKYKKLVVYEESIGQTATGKIKIPEVSLWYSEETSPIRMQSFIEKVKKILAKNKHLASESIVRCILLIYAGHPKKSTKPVESFNEIVELIQEVQAFQYFVLPDIRGLFPDDINFGDFTIGRLDENELRYKCQKAGSDYYELYKSDLHGKMVVKRQAINVHIINWHQFSYKYSLISDATGWLNRVLIYFECLSNELFEEFWKEFNEQQNLQIALGLPDIYDKTFRQLLNSEPITIFPNIEANGKRHGYVVPQKIGMLGISMDFDLGKKIDSLNQELAKEYNFSGFNETEIHKTIKSFAKFVAKAHRYLDDQKPDEGFVHFIIALDLLLGESSSSSKSVSERVAALVSLREGKEFEDVRKLVGKLYDARSKYVHEGQSVPDVYIQDTSNLCKTVLICLLSYQKHAIKDRDSTFEKWRKQLNLIVSSLVLEEPISDDFLLKIGVK
ncbi:HEPN domain-containing protein [Hymenobacter sp. ASUV-10]|uniref:HEPN domain-containing protein n=1 Tax=Hymenobacter aranciens TaxID=3063996 RepID=A0ABT9BD37_9BACT|nr:HEPN domain-containing protein [Hymenobacter sp. ASUV-10]MDO7876164.1 HEPN domain-containing protein [Hymenobacter sp. ASUV-10]